ncbi:MAG TPA: ArsR family transcriptional regulator [Pyrinomonadaceae bacterium]
MQLRLLNLTNEDEVRVCFFAGVIDTNQPKISRQLAYLRKAGLVTVRRDRNWRITALPSLKTRERESSPENSRLAQRG